MSPRFYWNKAPIMNAARAASVGALEDLKQPAQTTWESVVPVGEPRRGHEAGTLRDSWYSFVQNGRDAAILIFGAEARYAVYVELGTGKMAPRAPLRKTAQMIVPMMKQYLIRRAALLGITVR